LDAFSQIHTEFRFDEVPVGDAFGLAMCFSQASANFNNPKKSEMRPCGTAARKNILLVISEIKL